MALMEQLSSPPSAESPETDSPLASVAGVRAAVIDGAREAITKLNWERLSISTQVAERLFDDLYVASLREATRSFEPAVLPLTMDNAKERRVIEATPQARKVSLAKDFRTYDGGLIVFNDDLWLIMLRPFVTEKDVIATRAFLTINVAEKIVVAVTHGQGLRMA